MAELNYWRIETSAYETVEALEAFYYVLVNGYDAKFKKNTGIHLIGKNIGNKKFPEGKLIRTSRIISVKHIGPSSAKITTENNGEYSISITTINQNYAKTLSLFMLQKFEPDDYASFFEDLTPSRFSYNFKKPSK